MNYFSKLVFDHEVAHQLCNYSNTLHNAIIDNYENAFGYIQGNHFIRNYGELNAEESFCECVTYYINANNNLKTNYSLAYKSTEYLLSSITNLQDIYNRYYDTLYNDLNIIIEDFA